MRGQRKRITAPPCTGHHTFRLRGVVGGAEQAFDLICGEYRIGRSWTDNVRLKAVDVSRGHALLRITQSGLIVEDRGSTNGTFVDGRRIEQAQITAGSTLTFGTVDLKVETLEGDDAKLGLALEPPTAPGIPRIRERTSTTAFLANLLPMMVVPRTWLAHLGGFLEVLQDASGCLPDALAALSDGLGAEGGCVVRWSEEGDSLILASCGAVGTLPSHSDIHWPDAEDPQRVRTRFDRDPFRSAAFLFGTDEVCLALFLWGDYDGRSRSIELLRIAIRLLHHTASATPAHVPRTPKSSDRAMTKNALVFPAGYRPGTSPAMASLYGKIRWMIHYPDVPVLITGESGVGKEALVRLLHASSSRRDGPLVPINCAAIPADLLEAELFGIAKGVATGVETRPGMFRRADGGTLFLDEIGELSPASQAKLLRALQEKEVQAVGGNTFPIDVRVIAATNANLTERIASGRFRQDLYFRIAGFTLDAPPLRACTEDIPGLIQHFLTHFAAEFGCNPRGLSVKAQQLLTAYPWPGNVRELEHEMRCLVCQTQEGQTITSEMLSPQIQNPPTVADDTSGQASPGASLRYKDRERALKLELIQEALRRNQGRIGEAADQLGMHRNWLSRWINELEIDVRGERG